MQSPRLTATLLLALVWLGAALAVLQSFLTAGLPMRIESSLVAHLTGMAAGYGAAIMLILMSRSPWLERGVGSHRLARWHAWGGPLVIILTVVHATTAVLAWAQTASLDLMPATKDVLDVPGSRQPWSALRSSFSSELPRCGPCDDACRTSGGTRCTCSPILLWRWGLPINWLEPISRAADGCRLRGACCTRYAFALVVRWRVLQPLFQLWRHRLRVEDVRQESADVMSVLMSGRASG